MVRIKEHIFTLYMHIQEGRSAANKDYGRKARGAIALSELYHTYKGRVMHLSNATVKKLHDEYMPVYVRYKKKSNIGTWYNGVQLR